MKTLAQCRSLLKLTGWKIKTETDPKCEARDRGCRACLNWDAVGQTAIVRFRKKYSDEELAYLLWHELSHLVLADVKEFLKTVLTEKELAHYKQLQEQAVNQFSGALHELEKETDRRINCGQSGGTQS